VTHSMALTTPALLQGIDLHYQTENRLVWNEQEPKRRTRVSLRDQLDPRTEHVASLFAVTTEQISIAADRAASVAAMSSLLFLLSESVRTTLLIGYAKERTTERG
jgi:hypothetical protein